MRKLLLALLIAIALLSVATVAVALTLTPKKIAGSSTVDVSCPASGTPCSATVGWRLDDNYDVDACIVSWTPTFSGKATVACIVYDDSGTVKASGSINNVDVSNGVPETNTVELSSAVDPHDIYKVEVVIMEEM